jgi:Zn-dependent alcohol dehydrogenase
MHPAGWLNLIGQSASLSFANLVMVELIATFVFYHSDSQIEPDQLTPPERLAVYFACLFSCAVLCSCGSQVMTLVTMMGAWVHVMGWLVLVVALLATAEKLQTSSFVFQATFLDSAQQQAYLPNTM